MAYISFDPLRVVEQFARKMQSISNEFEKGVNMDFGNGFTPRVDINEDSKKVYLTFELPGIKKEDVKITINDENTLMVKGIKVGPDKSSETDKRTYIRLERKYGEFNRSFKMPDNINHNSIEANFNNGVLNITLGKIEPEKPREVEITVK